MKSYDKNSDIQFDWYLILLQLSMASDVIARTANSSRGPAYPTVQVLDRAYIILDNERTKNNPST